MVIFSTPAGAGTAARSLSALRPTRMGSGMMVSLGAQRHPALLDDGHDRAHEVLVGPHAPGDPVHDDADLVCLHGPVVLLAQTCSRIRARDLAPETRPGRRPSASWRRPPPRRSREPGLLDPAPDLPDVDAALAGQAAVQQQILGGRLPVADVKGEQVAAAAAAGDLRAAGRDPTTGGRRRPPPRRGASRWPRPGRWPAPGADGRAIVGVHRVQRLDRQLHAVGLGVGQHRLDAGADLIARRRQRLAGHRPAHQHDHRARPARRPRRWPGGCRRAPSAGRPRRGAGRSRRDTATRCCSPSPRSRSPACGGVPLAEGVPPHRDPLDPGGGVARRRRASSGHGLVVMVWTHSRARSAQRRLRRSSRWRVRVSVVTEGDKSAARLYLRKPAAPARPVLAGARLRSSSRWR